MQEVSHSCQWLAHENKLLSVEKGERNKFKKMKKESGWVERERQISLIFFYIKHHFMKNIASMAQMVYLFDLFLNDFPLLSNHFEFLWNLKYHFPCDYWYQWDWVIEQPIENKWGPIWKPLNMIKHRISGLFGALD